MSASLGFLSIRHHADHGYLGGYLITNVTGRPLEFHCTMPVKPSRAQELLYGPTIDDFVCGEQIAKALTIKAKLQPAVVLTDTPAALGLAEVSELLIVRIHFEPLKDDCQHLRNPAGSGSSLPRRSVGDWEFSLPPRSAAPEQLSDALCEVAPSFDLSEPFHRVTEALLEAHPIAKAA